MGDVFSIPEPYQVDLAVAQFLQGFQIGRFHDLMEFVSFLGDPLPRIILLILITFLVFLKSRRNGFFVAVSTSGAVVLSIIIKHLVDRDRPIATLVHDSFPSGHVLFFVGLFGSLLFLSYTMPHRNFYRFLLIMFFTLILILIGISRIYLGAHWFSDVIGAYLIGLFWLLVIIKIYKHTNN